MFLNRYSNFDPEELLFAAFPFLWPIYKKLRVFSRLFCGQYTENLMTESFFFRRRFDRFLKYIAIDIVTENGKAALCFKLLMKAVVRYLDLDGSL